ncbi:MAG TPA: glycosyltransferase family 2 protein [Gemmatimonadales bacterium]
MSALLQWLTAVVTTADLTIIWYFLIVNSFYALLLLLAVPEIWKHWKITRDEDLSLYLGSEALPPISILIPAYNMQASITDSVEAQLALDYPQHEVIVVNDGSTDGTMEQLRRAFELYEVPPAFPSRIVTQPVRAFYRSRTQPHLLVVDKQNGGKADALNLGISAARYPIVVAVDADTIVARDALLRLARPFLLGERVAAAGGTVRVANGCRIERAQLVEARIPHRFLPGIQVPEYLRAFLFGRLGWNRLGGNLIVSGAFGLFQRRHLLEIGGYTSGNVVEDLDLIVRLHQHLRAKGEPYDIPFIPDPVAWTEVPSDVWTHGRQRERWHRGLVVTMARHARLLFNPRYGVIGMVTMPFFFFGEMLAPLVEIVGYVLTALGLGLGILSVEFALLFLAAALGYQLLLTIWAVVLEEATFRVYRRFGDFLRILGYAVAEPFGYRQLTVFWRLKAFWNALRGFTHWGEMQRQGFQSRPA